MVVKVAATGFQWSQPILPHSPSSSQTLASAISSPSSSKRRCRGEGGPLVCRHVQRLHRSALLGTPSTRLHRSWSCELPKTKLKTISRATSASLDAFSDDEFSKKIQELALRFQLSDDSDEDSESRDSSSNTAVNSTSESSLSFIEEPSRINTSVNSVEDRNLFAEPPDWPAEAEGEIIPVSIERKANSVDLPLSLRIIKRKIQWQDSFREAGESAYCSVKAAFSSMVFIIRELHSYTLQMRELLFFEDLQGILSRVQKEMHASFVWLFQQVFSHTPTLMVYVMILLANFTVYSMGHNAIAAPSPPAVDTASVLEVQDHNNQKFDSSAIKTFSVSFSGWKTTSIGGNNGGGGKVPPVASGTDGDGGFNQSDQYRAVLPDGASQLPSAGSPVSEAREEEVALWNSIVNEASEMQALLRDEALDRETIQLFVSPVNAKIESDDYEEYFRTDLLYQTSLSQDPNNSLLLANYAQFLLLVAHDYDRAEDYFKRATAVEPADAEAYNKYATFLWRIRNDLWAAEETFLEAISADPGNSHYAANYAHFLWNTGGEDTCFPLSSPEADITQES